MFCPNAALPLNSSGLSEVMKCLIEVSADLQNPVSPSVAAILCSELSLSLSLFTFGLALAGCGCFIQNQISKSNP